MNKITAIFLATALVPAVSACTKKENQAANPAQTQTAQPGANSMMTPPGGTGELKIENEVVGKGAEAVAGKKVSVHYTGWLTNGTKFDSSKDRAQPFSFTLGAGQVIPGWDKGVAGMKVGGKRKLTIPPQMAYGERGAGSVIPPNSTLVFEVELLDVK